MPRLTLVLITLAVGAALAFLAGSLFFDKKHDDRTTPTPTETGRTPAFHLRLTPPARLEAARQCLNLLTSAKAVALGGNKDDLALLADDPAVIDLILRHCNERANLSKYEGSGFSDIFERVKHPAFVEPTLRLFSHEDIHVRQKAVPAARTQAHPSLSPALKKLWDELHQIREQGAGEASGALIQVMEAMVRSGGDLVPVIIAQGLEDKSRDVRYMALELLADQKLEALLPRATRCLDDPEPLVRLHAAKTLLAFGNRRGLSTLLGFLDPQDPTFATQALLAVREHHVSEAIPALKEHLPHAPITLQPEFTVLLVLLGDDATERELLEVARDPETTRDRYALAILGLAATGKSAYRGLLEEALERGGPWVARSLCDGLAATPKEPDLEFVERNLSNPELRHPTNVAALVNRMGEALLPYFDRELRNAKDESRIHVVLSCLGMINTEKARELALAHRDVHPRLVEEQVRLMDLSRRKRGTP